MIIRKLKDPLTNIAIQAVGNPGTDTAKTILQHKPGWQTAAILWSVQT